MKQVHAPQTETRQEQKELTAKQKVQIQDTEDKTQKEGVNFKYCVNLHYGVE